MIATHFARRRMPSWSGFSDDTFLVLRSIYSGRRATKLPRHGIATPYRHGQHDTIDGADGRF